MTRTQEDKSLQTTARGLEEMVTRKAIRARKDAIYARREGIAPIQEMSLFANAADQTRIGLAAWLRGAATALLPRGWRFTVEEAQGGGAVLKVLGFEQPATSPSRAPYGRMFR